MDIIFVTFPDLLAGIDPAATLAGKQTKPQPSWLHAYC